MYVDIGGITFDALSNQAKWYGIVLGTQYQGLAKEGEAVDDVSNCFYATYAEVQSVISLSLQWEQLSVGTWFNTLFIAPFQSLANLSVVSEYCNFYAYLDIFQNAASLDYSAITNQVVGNGLYITQNLPNMTSQINSLKGVVDTASDAASDAAEDAEASIRDRSADQDAIKEQAQDVAEEAKAKFDHFKLGKLYGQIMMALSGVSAPTQ